MKVFVVVCIFLVTFLILRTDCKAGKITRIQRQEPQDNNREIAAIKARIETFDELWAVGNATTLFKALYKKDAILMPQGSPFVTGQAAIDVLAADMSYYETLITSEDLRVNNGWAIERTSWLIKDGEAVLDKGKGLSFWEKCEDGIWYLSMDIYNSDGPTM